MPNTIVMKQTTVDEIEFYVSNDGTETGLSLRGLAKLCGVQPSAVIKLVDNLSVTTSPAPESLKHLQGKGLECSLSAENNAKVIKAEIAAQIIEYYAFESKAANDTAKYSFRKFASQGINTWIKQITGFETNQIPQATEIVGLLNQLINKVDTLEQETKEYRTMRGRTVQVFPALDKMLDELAMEDELLLAEDSSETCTLTEWIIKTKKGITLDKSAKHRFALLVAETYRSVTGKDPKRENRYDKATKKQNVNVCVYDYNEFPILQLAWNKAFNM